MNATIRPPRLRNLVSAALLPFAFAAHAQTELPGPPDGYVAPYLVLRLQTGGLFDIPDTRFTRGYVLGMFSHFNHVCEPVAGENPGYLVRRAMNLLDQRQVAQALAMAQGMSGSFEPSPANAPPAPEGWHDAALALKAAGGCDDAGVRLLRKGVYSLIDDRSSASPQPDDSLQLVAHLLGTRYAQRRGVPAPKKPVPLGATQAVVCWRAAVKATPQQMAAHNPKTDGTLPQTIDFPEYKELRSRLVAGLSRPAATARSVVGAGLHPVAYVEFPEDWSWRHAVTWQGVRSAAEQRCRFVGYVAETLPLR